MKKKEIWKKKYEKCGLFNALNVLQSIGRYAINKMIRVEESCTRIVRI